MNDFIPPTGPPPPTVPEGWKAVFNDQYKEWFYVNLHTKKSQWERPTAPALPIDTPAPDGLPPSYEQEVGHTQHTDHKAGTFQSNNPFNGTSSSTQPYVDEDARLAAQLQEEEDARARGARPSGATGPPNAQQDYQNTPMPPSAYDQAALPPRPQERGGGAKGLLGKLLGKASSSGHHSQPYGHSGGYGYQSHGSGYGGYGGHGGYPPYGGHGGGFGGFGGHGPKRRHGGLGAGGGAALGLGGGLLGGAMLANAMDNDHDHDQGYDEGYEDGGGGDFDGGGGDGGGGD
ncbi:MAG: hypothetical protein M1833_006604 [Piccolia ochrophora]|nr:MAG: hypothetical protein M1833_006604 [Piccolia ochrophora]